MDAETLRAYLRNAAQAADTDLTGLARRCGLAPTTLTRFVNSSDAKHLPSTTTLAKVAKVSGLPLPGTGGEALSRAKKIEVLQAVARALDLDLADVAISARDAEWLDVIDRIPASLHDNALEMLRGVADVAGPPQKHSGPGEGLRRRRKA